MRVEEASQGRLSVLSSFSVKVLEEGGDLIHKKWISVVFLDSQSLDSASSVIVSMKPIIDEVGESMLKEWTSNWMYDKIEGIWDFLDYPKARYSFFMAMDRRIVNEEVEPPEGLALNHFWIANGAELRREKIRLGEQVGKYFTTWTKYSGRIWRDRLYIVHQAKGEEGEQAPWPEELSAFVRSELPGEGGFTYSKIGTIASGAHGITFVGENEELKVVVMRQGETKFLPEILVTDWNLVVSHKLALGGLCGGIRSSQVTVSILPGLVGGDTLVLSFSSRDLESTHLEYVFLYDLADLSLRRVRREDLDLTSGGGVVEGGGEQIEAETRGGCHVSLWGPHFLMLDDSAYTFDLNNSFLLFCFPTA